MATMFDRIKHAWNAFMNRDPTRYFNPGYGSSFRPDRARYSAGNERSIISGIFTRISIDVSAIVLKHVQLDEHGRYSKDINSGLNECLTVSANIDQTGRDLLHDFAMSILDEGCACLVPVDTSESIYSSSSFDIFNLRVGKITQWHPTAVHVELYNEHTGQKDTLLLPKRSVAIVENPFYAIMNEYNSTLQRLIRKLNIMDYIDEQNGSNKLNIIVQLPYLVRGEARKNQAEQRRAEIEEQLTSSKFGIAYTDATEHIVQLNRAIENNLLPQIQDLMHMLYSQLGITESILDGTADEKVLLNYYNNTIEPLVSAIANEMTRKFLTANARTRGQTIAFFRDPFRLVPVGNVAEIADKFTRNEIMTSNEIRQIVGMAPSADPKADQLVNSNISQPNDQKTPPALTDKSSIDDVA